MAMQSSSGPIVDSPVWREDLVFALCASTIVIGLFLDGWNHINLQNGALGSFFTPWHGVLYAGFSITATWLALRNSKKFCDISNRRGIEARAAALDSHESLAVLWYPVHIGVKAFVE